MVDWFCGGNNQRIGIMIIVSDYIDCVGILDSSYDLRIICRRVLAVDFIRDLDRLPPFRFHQ